MISHLLLGLALAASPAPSAARADAACPHAAATGGGNGFASPSDAGSPAPPAVSPYVARVSQPIKALSPEETRQLRAGEGMGLAIAAELNGYPGPKHVLELAAELALRAAQRATVRAAYEAMHVEAMRLGEQVIAAEARLDALFARREVDEASLRAAVEEASRLRGELRFVHLRAHLATAAALDAEQTVRYAALRGYGAAASAHAHGHEH